MALAERMRVSPRRLAGWEPKETTEYFDADGLLVFRSVTTREAEWDMEQVDMLLAAQAFKADIGPHGHLLSKATSPEADPMNYRSSLGYVGHGPFWDYAKKAELDRIDAYKSQFPKDSPPNLNGAYFTVEEIGG